MDKKFFANLLGTQMVVSANDDSSKPKDLAGSFLKDVSGGAPGDDLQPGFIQSLFESFGESGAFSSSFAKGGGT